MTHHLYVPKLYVQYGGIRELPDIIYSYYPQLIDLLYCIPLSFGNDILPKYIHFSFALFTAFLIFQYTKKNISRFYSWISALFFLSTPVIVKLAVTVYVDLGLIFFSTAALLSLIKWHEKKNQIFWLILSGSFCGLALSCKYNGLITFFILTAFVPAIYIKANRGNTRVQLKALGHAILFFAISISVFSPWMIKNYMWTQNPVYPLYDTYLNRTARQTPPQITAKPKINHFLVRKYVYKEKWWETLTIPVRLFFQGKDDSPKFFDGKLNLFLLLLPFFAFINKSSKPSRKQFEKKIFVLFSLLFIMIVFFRQDMRIRWIAPAIPPLVILSMYSLENIFDKLTHIPQKKITLVQKKHLFPTLMVSSLLFFMFLLNALYLNKLFRHIDPLTYLSGQISRLAYIEKFRPEILVIQHANHNLSSASKLLGLFLGDRGYYFDNDIKFDLKLFEKIVHLADKPEKIHSRLKKQKFTDLILNHEKLNHWINITFTNKDKQKIQLFFKNFVDPVFQKNGYGLYHLK